MSATDDYEEEGVGGGGSATPVYSCKRCKKTFPCKRDQLLHKKEVHYQAKSSYECKLCAKYFCNSGNLERHMKVHNDVRPFVCRICEKAFAQAVNLQRHYSVHNGERPYPCSFCTKSFTQQSNMQRHQLTHTGEKPFRCKRCGRYFSQRVNLKKHIMGHLNTKPYACKICQKAFIQLANFKRHLQAHVKEGVAVDVSAAVQAAALAARQSLDIAAQPVAFECAVCRSVFDNFTNFELHENECEGGGSTITQHATNATHASSQQQQQQQQQQLQQQQQEQQQQQQQQQVQQLQQQQQLQQHAASAHAHALQLHAAQALGGMFSPMKFSVPHLDTHEIVIETSR